MIEQIPLVLFNILNAFFDAARIKKQRRIYHAINGLAYLIVVGLVIWFGRVEGWKILVYLFSAFFNRQLFFDIPLNLLRGLRWDYFSTEKPPKAILDRIEIRIFGYNGKLPVLIYTTLWIASTVIYQII